MPQDDTPSAIELLNALRRMRRVRWNGPAGPDASFAGLKPSELSLLYRIRRCGQAQGIKVTDLSSMLRVTSPTVTQLVNGLETRFLLERAKDVADGRIVLVKLTEEGDRIAQKAEQEMMAGFQAAVEHLGAEKTRQLIDRLSELYRYFEERGELNPLQRNFPGEEQ
jgi:DNA-binding MarR family transcriptional regulator